MRLQANSAMRTTFTSADSIIRKSSSQRDSGHCSGYHAVPIRIAFCPGIWVGMEAGNGAAVWADAEVTRSTHQTARQRNEKGMHGS